MKVLTLGSFFVKVDNKEGFVRDDFLATFVFLAFDAAVSAGKFSSECVGDLADVPVYWV